MAREVEVLDNAEGRVGIIIEAMAAAPVSYRIVDHAAMVLELVCDDGSRHPIAFPEGAGAPWQKLIDNEELLVTEVNAESVEPSMDDIVRDEWLKPEVVV